jgi:hypothetical protein
VFEITEIGGNLRAVCDSIDQGAAGIPVSRIVAEGGKLQLEMKSLNAEFVGDRKNDAYVGTFTQNGAKFPLTLARIEKRPAVTRPQDPKKPYPYLEEEVTVENRSDANRIVQLAGTLTLPKTGGPYPAVVLITGSGAQNRDEEIFNHRPFWVIADDLTKRGVAVLRMDDRGVGKSSQGTANDTSETFVGDILAAVDYLKSRPEIDPKRIGLVGHSEGGLIGPMAATRRPQDVAFVAMLAGPALPGKDILYMQAAAGLKAVGMSQSAIADNRQVQEALFAVVEKQPDPAKAAAELDAALSTLAKKLGSPFREQLQNETFRKSQIAFVNSPWTRFFLTFDPRPTLVKVECPILAVWGEKDVQVPATENRAAFESAMKAANRTNYECAVLPKLNHLFQTSATGAPSEYGVLSETVSPTALKLMGEWIAKRTSTNVASP